MEPIRLWRYPSGSFYEGEFPEPGWTATEYAALPRADYEALLREKQEAVRLATVAGVCELAAHNPNVASYCREWEDRANAATARADKAEALLREARGWLAALLKVGADKPAVDALLARIDAHLAAKGQTAPTPADPTNPAPAATSADGCTEQKEP